MTASRRRELPPSFKCTHSQRVPEFKESSVQVQVPCARNITAATAVDRSWSSVYPFPFPVFKDSMCAGKSDNGAKRTLFAFQFPILEGACNVAQNSSHLPFAIC